MIWNTHYGRDNEHAFLSPSKGSWVNYDERSLRIAWGNHKKAALGTRIHALAADLIRLGIKLPKTTATLNMFVNDGIGYKMTPEQVLYYSPNAFGTTDCIAFSESILRIHDLKTGTSRGHMIQLKIYAAFFCLEYGVKPSDITIILRLYQNDEVLEESPHHSEIDQIMTITKLHDKTINNFKAGLL